MLKKIALHHFDTTCPWTGSLQCCHGGIVYKSFLAFFSQHWQIIVNHIINFSLLKKRSTKATFIFQIQLCFWLTSTMKRNRYIVYNIWTNLQLFPDSNPSYGYVAVADLREIYIIQHMCFNIYTKRVKNLKKKVTFRLRKCNFLIILIIKWNFNYYVFEYAHIKCPYLTHILL